MSATKQNFFPVLSAKALRVGKQSNIPGKSTRGSKKENARKSKSRKTLRNSTAIPEDSVQRHIQESSKTPMSQASTTLREPLLALRKRSLPNVIQKGFQATDRVSLPHASKKRPLEAKDKDLAFSPILKIPKLLAMERSLNDSNQTLEEILDEFRLL